MPIAWRPAHWVSASSFSVQRLPRWFWSISKAFGRVTATDLMLASPGRVVRSNCRLGSLPRLVALWPPSWRIAHLRLEGKRGAVDRAGRARRRRPGALVADPLRRRLEPEQLVGLIMKFGLVDVDLDRAHAQGDAADDRGHGFGVGEDVGVERVDVEGDADDDGAVVIGPGEGRGDRRRG